ncbi:four-carbon acid sugar kinase family protein [Eubacterium sp. MSJ-13]|uniref:four-carbon acid sugar kinase family protein n=1 Tax=Eubacterium sp. MSJ-13 TaxID=2841513 RepID=UPI001C124C16|nr:four-carbon acid sugar kinase family protein [Eubacterium sp. MSJ-13]MBU5478653.1 four-carbon acid sugar kinase family protein [Eubacterium sp. MSJ-13]
MVELLILTDDFTGALDTGVQFSEKGILTQVVVSKEWPDINTECEVLVIDAETRHVSQESAYKTVYEICEEALKQKIPYVYKKTDSALRGNAGCEIQAVQDAYMGRKMLFLPAFPKMNRIVKEGILYIDQIPVTKSVFGQDPFEPVQYDDIEEILKNTGYHDKILKISKKQYLLEQEKADLLLFDTENENELHLIAKEIKEKSETSVFAGCAGFAAQLPEMLSLKTGKTRKYKTKSNLIIVCGSVNPITRSQLSYAEKRGMKKINLKPEEKLEKSYWDSEEGKEKIEQIVKNKGDHFIIDGNDKEGSNDTIMYVRAKKYDTQEMRERVSQTMGYLTKSLIDDGMDGTFLITGGDTLLGFMDAIGCKGLEPIKEICPGCVLASLKYKNRDFYIITKSGGFGQEKLIEELINFLKEE